MNKWYKYLKILWDFAQFLEKYWPEESSLTDEKDLLKKIVLKLFELIDEKDDQPVHTMGSSRGH